MKSGPCQQTVFYDMTKKVGAFRHRCGAWSSKPMNGRKVVGRFDSYAPPPCFPTGHPISLTSSPVSLVPYTHSYLCIVHVFQQCDQIFTRYPKDLSEIGYIQILMRFEPLSDA